MPDPSAIRPWLPGPQALKDVGFAHMLPTAVEAHPDGFVVHWRVQRWTEAQYALIPKGSDLRELPAAEQLARARAVAEARGRLARWVRPQASGPGGERFEFVTGGMGGNSGPLSAVWAGWSRFRPGLDGIDRLHFACSGASWTLRL